MTKDIRPNGVTDIQKNVGFCLSYFHQTTTRRKELAAALDVNESTVARWFKLKSEPHRSQLSKLADLCGIPLAWFSKRHGEFVELIRKQDAAKLIFRDYARIDRRIVLACTERWRHIIGDAFERHRGTYYMYCRALSDPNLLAVSLLRIQSNTRAGITFDIHNVDTRVAENSSPVIYHYRGLMFPVFDCLSFYGEDDSGNEPLSMVTSSAQVPRKSILTGYFAAVGVVGGTRNPTGAKVALTFRSAELLNPETELKRLGLFPFENTPTWVKPLL